MWRIIIMQKCVNTYTYVHTHIQIHAHIHTHVHILHTSRYKHMHICIHIYTRIHKGLSWPFVKAFLRVQYLDPLLAALFIFFLAYLSDVEFSLFDSLFCGWHSNLYNCSFFIATVDTIINAYLIIALWLFSSLLKTNHVKTKVLLVSFLAVVIRCKTLVLFLNSGGSIITYLECVKDLGVIFDSSLSFQRLHSICQQVIDTFSSQP